MGQEHEDGAKREHRGGREDANKLKDAESTAGADRGARITNESFAQKKPVAAITISTA